MVKRSSVVFLFALLNIVCLAQSVTPYARFLDDSTTIGEKIRFSLSVEYPSYFDVVFPDSTTDFSPFEYLSKEYFPTRLDSATAFDSVVYMLSTFEIDTFQSLQLPIYLVDGNDSVEIKSNPDSVVFMGVVKVIPDSLELRSNTTYLPVDYTFNYPYLIIGVAIFGALATILVLVFGKTVRTRFRLYKLKKDFENFSTKFDQGISKIRKNQTSKSLIEEILVLWKTYMEKLEDKPFTKYTSKEIKIAGYSEELQHVLQSIDRSIYGSFDNQEMHKNFESLEDFTIERYQSKLEELKNE